MHINLALPAIKNGKMVFKKWNINAALFYNKENFYTPAEKSLTITPNIIIVPLLAFDQSGYRLGYGKGYYDKYYSLNKKIKYYGYAFDVQSIISLPCEAHDLKLKNVITEKTIYTF